MKPMLIVTALSLLAAPSMAQEIVKVDAKDAPTVARPDDLYTLPPGKWHFAKQLWSGNEPCDNTHCEAGYTDGIIAVSVERSEKYVRLIAGLRNCESVGFSEMEIGNNLKKSESNRIAKQVKNVVKGIAKTCKVTAPKVPALDAAQLSPAKVG